ncbi:MAG: hypothetical protein RR388_06960 [Rikenellaceae bacterium]
MSKYMISEVKTSSDIKEFLKLPKKIYKGYNNWIHPLDNDIEAVFNKEKNKMFIKGEAVRFLVRDSSSGECVGRIAAFYNERVAFQGDLKVGGCGFFESINSQEVAFLMFDTVQAWLVSKGMNAMDGPINFGDREMWWGLLTDGFTQPVYGMNYNHPYYKELFEAYGFQDYFNGFSFRRDLKTDTLSPMLVEKARRLAENPSYKFCHIKKSELDKVALDFCDIYRRAWAKFDSVAPITKEDAVNMMLKLKPIIDEKLIYFAYYNNEPIGFFIMIPDINSTIRPLNGKLDLIGKLRFFYRLKIKRVGRLALGLIFGVIPEHQGKGVESGIINCFKEEVNKGNINYDSLDLAWVGDFNPLMIRMVEKYVGAVRHKTHTTYRFLFDRNRAFERAPKVSMSRESAK